MCVRTYRASCGNGAEFEDAFKCGLSPPTRTGNVVEGVVEKRWSTTYIWFRGKLALQMFLVLPC